MRTIIHDLNENDLIKFKFDDSDKIIDSNNCHNHCIGCFSCWTKHPTHCVYKDNYSSIVGYLKESDELVLISKCRYGCYSNTLKQVIERIIGYVLPYFTIRNDEIHHKSRYDNRIKLTVYAYGNINEDDKEVLENLVRANAVNFNAREFKVNFIENIEETKNVYID